ncbi:DUF1801 domain-containing protein [Novosphingobium sp. PASSN1]|uniref:DUF1801 domain-containing protein n=1 Tax=Novosphingobium sp. PASSN1 TaxID=2015561 RepID=UPI000BD7E0CB|nr:DUF1801 domain-containing protein [Novosphingobium sp. PASSN1]OYU34245.1 MAG: hypothetical protein CFE35_16685 [Novosphingobium sp. PASSN1]
MATLFRLPWARPHDPAVVAWFAADSDGLRLLARPWFDRMRGAGDDVLECLHDGAPTACVGDAAFAYVAAFSRHVNIGFFHGAALPDPAGLLVGNGKRMRHVKLHWGEAVDEAALAALIAAGYRDMAAAAVRG